MRVGGPKAGAIAMTRDEVIHIAVAIGLVRVAAAGCCVASDTDAPGRGSTGTAMCVPTNCL